MKVRPNLDKMSFGSALEFVRNYHSNKIVWATNRPPEDAQLSYKELLKVFNVCKERAMQLFATLWSDPAYSKPMNIFGVDFIIKSYVKEQFFLAPTPDEVRFEDEIKLEFVKSRGYKPKP